MTMQGRLFDFSAHLRFAYRLPTNGLLAPVWPGAVTRMREAAG
jgi:hypothetical protein